MAIAVEVAVVELVVGQETDDTVPVVPAGTIAGTIVEATGIDEVI